MHLGILPDRCGVALVIAVLGSVSAPAHAGSYTVQTLQVGGTTERRCFLDGFHFLTFVDDGNGTFAIRAHPGVDPNGWGTTVYLQPFLPGAVLRHTVYTNFAAAADHIDIDVAGNVSLGQSGTYGTWNAQLDFQYLPSAKEVIGSGSYSITLAGPLSSVGDLNLLKMASNFLINVPLLTCAVGNTGDMTSLHVVEDALEFDWIPGSPNGFCPQDHTNLISLQVIGRLNNVDTLAQGHPFGIAPAYKPSVTVGLTSQQSGVPMIFCGFFDPSYAQDFAADNVGITPLILQQSATTAFDFDVSFSSSALAADGNDLDFDGVPDPVDPFPRCATCPGNLGTDCRVDGDDIQTFVGCLLSGDPATTGCGCADMDANDLIDGTDLAAFVSQLLNGMTSCP